MEAENYRHYTDMDKDYFISFLEYPLESQNKSDPPSLFILCLIIFLFSPYLYKYSF